MPTGAYSDISSSEPRTDERRMEHALRAITSRGWEHGNAVITGATAPMWGYHSALERTPYRLDAP